MLKIELAIPNPLSKGTYSEYYNYNGIISGNKYIDVSVDLNTKRLLDFDLDCNWFGKNHAGPSIGLRVFGFGFFVEIYDRREWNYLTNSWQYQDSESGS